MFDSLIKIIENAEKSKSFYHGSTSPIEKFSLDYVGDGHDQYGVGIYLTSDMSNAKTYGEYVHHVAIDPNIRLVPDTARI